VHVHIELFVNDVLSIRSMYHGRYGAWLIDNIVANGQFTTDSPQLMATATTRPWPSVAQSIPRVGLGITVFYILALPRVMLGISAKEVNRLSTSYDMICQQSAMFIKRCLYSDSLVVKHVALHSVFYGRMASCISHNPFTCSERYDVSVNGIVHSAFNGHSVKSLCERRTPLVYYSSALATLELLMIRRGILYVPNMSADDINALLSAVCRPTNCQ